MSCIMGGKMSSTGEGALNYGEIQSCDPLTNIQVAGGSMDSYLTSLTSRLPKRV